MRKESLSASQSVRPPFNYNSDRDDVSSPKSLVTLGAIAGTTSLVEIARGYRLHGILGLTLSAVLLSLSLPEYRSQRRMWKQITNIMEGGE